MKPQAFKKMNIETKINKLQENISLKFDQFDDLPFAKGNYVTTVVNGAETNILPLTTTATDFSHKLGKEPEGYFIVYQDSNAVIWWDRTGTEDRNKFIKLDASASVNAKIWVF